MADAATLAPYNYTQLIGAGLIGFAVFGDLPDGWTFVGALIIVAAGLYVACRERRRAGATASVTPRACESTAC
jgi:drug/metabolite transporter (DMT)-like permease